MGGCGRSAGDEDALVGRSRVGTCVGTRTPRAARCDLHNIQPVDTDTDRFLFAHQTPIHMPYRASKKARLTRLTGGAPAVTKVGIEELTVSNGGGSDEARIISFAAASYSWAKHVESTDSYGPAVLFKGAFRCELRDSYIHSTGVIRGQVPSRTPHRSAVYSGAIQLPRPDASPRLDEQRTSSGGKDAARGASSALSVIAEIGDTGIERAVGSGGRGCQSEIRCSLPPRIDARAVGRLSASRLTQVVGIERPLYEERVDF